MVRYMVLSESEIFCTKLSYNLGDENFKKYMGDPGSKDEDAERGINARIHELIQYYRKEFTCIQDDYKATAHDLAKALYFATYYNETIEDFKKYAFYRKYTDHSDEIGEFINVWNGMRSEILDDDYERMEGRLKDFDFYKKTLKRS